MEAIEPFTIAVADEVLDDLRSRLRNTRWPEGEPVDDWTQGTPLAYLQELCSYWADEYDWRTREAALNRFDHFRTEIDGLGIHFIHQRSPHAEARPLLLSHGWPGSIVEFHKVIEPLTDPVAHGGDAADAFHVVAPSLPGFGFSDKPTETGWSIERMGEAFSALMARLGYDRYLAQGGDWGSGISAAIGAQDPDHCQGIHINLVSARPDPATMDDLTEFEQKAIAKLSYYMEWDSGYSKQQGTRPQTVGYGLVDSPAAQAGWVIEKFWAWTDNNGHPEDALTRDELLDNLMLYWVPGTGASSARIYWESFGKGVNAPVEIPMGASIFPEEIMMTSRRWAEQRFHNIVHWNELDRGGHFAAFEVPDLYVDEVRTWARAVPNE